MIREEYINRCLQWLTDEVVTYYDNNMLPKELSKRLEIFYDCLANSIDWSSLTQSELRRLGFLNWEEDEHIQDTGVWFIPNWLFHSIPEGIQLYDKDGIPFEYHASSAPKELMYGCLTFGVKLNIN